MFLNGGSMLPPLLLAVRHAGYGDRVDDALASLNDFLEVLTDPRVRKILDKM